MTRLRTAVVGAGYLGRFHAQKYAAHPDCELIGVVDVDLTRAKSIAEELDCLAFDSVDAIRSQVDAVSVAAPTRLHHELGQSLLEAGLHVLIEKPMTVTVAEAESLITAADKHDCILQVGHLERFNPAVVAAAALIDNPLFIESHRIAPFNPRGADVSVVLDLMIHDIDLILELVNAELVAMDASGAAVISDDIDMANARLRFANGCVANVTASRVSPRAERRMRVFQRNAYLSLDLQNGTLDIQRRDPQASGPPTMAQITHERLEPGRNDALADEINSFISTIQNKTQPVVTGQDGKRALAAAIEISRQLTENSQ
ncbi:MAG: Gfo/Idh/MocA family oxidoreductase [Gammaproteobacteria bacterium]|nr:Gfo/Idh/MocA family oxidoreductase [Gammaproteobacteria bacterium]